METDKKALLLKEKLLAGMSKKKLLIMASIIQDKKPCSLRIIEWFVSSYCKEHSIIYDLNGKPFNVYSSYKNEQLVSFNKKLFDIYRRTEIIKIPIQGSKPMSSTVGQLNFFNWLFNTKIVDYITANLKKLKSELDKAKPGKKQTKFFEKVTVSKINVTIYFD